MREDRSLTHLQRLPVDTLKVDRSFVLDVDEQPATAAIVRSMIDLAHTLGQRVVAKGVEDAALWQRLADWGCDMAQGWVVAARSRRPTCWRRCPNWTRAQPKRLAAAGCTS